LSHDLDSTFSIACLSSCYSFLQTLTGSHQSNSYTTVSKLLSDIEDELFQTIETMSRKQQLTLLCSVPKILRKNNVSKFVLDTLAGRDELTFRNEWLFVLAHISSENQLTQSFDVFIAALKLVLKPSISSVVLSDIESVCLK